MMGQKLLRKNLPSFLYFFGNCQRIVYSSFQLLGWKGLLSTQGSAENQTQFPFFSFMFLVLFPVAVAGVEILLKGASFSQLCRLSFSLLFVSWLVVAGGGQVAVVTGHEAKLL